MVVGFPRRSHKPVHAGSIPAPALDHLVLVGHYGLQTHRAGFDSRDGLSTPLKRVV